LRWRKGFNRGRERRKLRKIWGLSSTKRHKKNILFLMQTQQARWPSRGEGEVSIRLREVLLTTSSQCGEPPASGQSRNQRRTRQQEEVLVLGRPDGGAEDYLLILSFPFFLFIFFISST
jgi:hypothetical protein